MWKAEHPDYSAFFMFISYFNAVHKEDFFPFINDIKIDKSVKSSLILEKINAFLREG